MKDIRQRLNINTSSSSLSQVWPPCRVACPVHADVQKYVGLIAQEKLQEALSVIRETIVFAAVCGRICPHPCEDVCRRGKVDEPLAIASLKRFAADSSYSFLKVPKPAQIFKKRVAVIGAGPAGLTAAKDLAELGYQVTVFDKMPEPGGMLRYGVPRYRLPTEALMQDIKPILDLGVDLQTGVEIGKDLSFNALMEKGFDAILISVGLSVSRKLDIEGVELSGVLLAIPFLQEVNTKGEAKIGKKVVVVGGGDVAMDVARTAIRLGASEVNIACLECGDEIPAHPWELSEALEEGAKLHPAKGPKRFLGENGKVTGVEFMEVKSVFDEEGRFCPTFHKDKTCTIEGDTVILAIGQTCDLSFLEDTPIKLENGRLAFDPETFSTSHEGIFACGEVIKGPGSAIEAIANAHRAAASIHNYLQTGKLSPVTEENYLEVDKLKKETLEKIKKAKRYPMLTVEPKERIKNFDQFELGYQEEEAVKEAQRCLSCTQGAEVIKEKCAACLTCLRVCPFDVPYIRDGEFAGIDISQCQSCGVCASECPAGAIFLKFFTEEEILADVKELVSGINFKPVLAVVCGYGYWSLDRSTRENLERKDIVVKKVLCIARVGADTFLKFFELGVGGIIVGICDDFDCRYFGATGRIKERLFYVKDVLKEAGFQEEKLQLFNLSKGCRKRELDKLLAKISGIS